MSHSDSKVFAKNSHDILTVIFSYSINFTLLLHLTNLWVALLLHVTRSPFTVTQIVCIPLHYNHETWPTAEGHISQCIVQLCPNCLVCKIRYNYMYMSYFLQNWKSSLLICASLNQMNKLGLLDHWSWERQLSWNISNCWSVLHNITEEQRTHLHRGRNLI